MLRKTLFLIAWGASFAVHAESIDGSWQHADEPAWITITLDQGTGVVVRNDKYPERVGRELLKDLQADDTQADVWRGQVYVERFGEYKDAQITLNAQDQMQITVKVGFISRTVEWTRVQDVPAAPEG